MRILVLIKQVPHAESIFEISQDGSTIQFPAHTSYAINSYDEYAIEEALILSEKIPETVISVVTLGPERAELALRRALAMGAHYAYHCVIQNEDMLSSMEKSEILAEFAKNHPFDIIIAGTMSESNAHAAVGPMIAARLRIPWATHIISLKINIPEKTITAEREIDVATKQSMILPLPALVAVQSGINRPRYPSLSNALRAKKQEIEKIILNQPSQSVVKSRFSLPRGRKGTQMLRGTREEKALALIEYLHAKSLLGGMK